MPLLQCLPAQLSSYVYKVFMMLVKYAEFAGCEVNIHHLLHLFLPSFYRVH